MKIDKNAMLLYAVTDRAWTGNQTLVEQVEAALVGGITFLQLREKNLGYDEFLQEAIELKKLTDFYHVPFVINDNVEIALACDADGVHVGQEDMPVEKVRDLIGRDKILGVSAQNVEQAIAAEKAGADYLGIGSVFPTSTKSDAKPMTFETVQEICRSVSIPIVAIGGITKTNILELSGSGVDGVAVVSAIFAQSDITVATKALRKLSTEMVGRD
ncbi:thiamine phosphate synthase [Bacillus timonensis]|uniref:Thiamine-phosphate synthase n=1 Tax=Bacillus timonensis TaxID=1033734 RepID=A0A4S3PUU3_9BACI|nr:thiamine phosphate synthase [Bacillus timonensis]THE13264.1 thiamine phosphate synthase [Bacillus timonensis]